MRLLRDRAGAEDDDGDAGVAGDEAAVARRGPTGRRQAGPADVHHRSLGRDDERLVLRGLEPRHLHRHPHGGAEPAVPEPERRDAPGHLDEDVLAALGGEQPAVGDDEALGRDRRGPGTAVHLPDAPRRRADERVRVGRQLVVPSLEVSDQLRRSVDGVRAVPRVPGVRRPPGEVDLDVGVPAGGDDGLQVGGFRDDAPGERGAVGSGEVAAHPLARLLLVDEGGQLDRSAQASAGTVQRRHRDDARREAALHVGGSAAVQTTHTDDATERRHRPPLAGGDDVRVTEEQQPRAVPAVQHRRHVRAAGFDLVGHDAEAPLSARSGEDLGGRLLTPGRVLTLRSHERGRDLTDLVQRDEVEYRPLRSRQGRGLTHGESWRPSARRRAAAARRPAASAPGVWTRSTGGRRCGTGRWARRRNRG